MSASALDLLLTRRSVVAKKLVAPGPDAETLARILTAGLRVPDHKILQPWRILTFSPPQRHAFADIVAGLSLLRDDPSAFAADEIEKERQRFLRAPTVIAVISSLQDRKPVPEWEQELSAGAVCQNILHAAAASGFAGQWITEWLAYDARVAGVLGLGARERVAGFIYLGTAEEAPKERARPEFARAVSAWEPPKSDAEATFDTPVTSDADDAQARAANPTS
ncbi:MAG: nitroreductase [Pseudomonadota bacterium]